MKSRKPIIGITPGYDYDKKMLYVKKGYFEGINEAGGLAVILPVTESKELIREISEMCDGILVTGGPDIDARHFGENNHEFNGEISPVRDIIELNVIRDAFSMNKPILAICRGIQVLNVAFGGTLYQDIKEQYKSDYVIKHSQSAPKWYPTHDVLIEKGSKLMEIFETGTLGVNSFHHQSIKDAANDFIVSGRSPDGIIEAIEHKNKSFIIGVQWHPELMWRKNPEFLKLFKELVRYAGLENNSDL